MKRANGQKERPRPPRDMISVDLGPKHRKRLETILVYCLSELDKDKVQAIFGHRVPTRSRIVRLAIDCLLANIERGTLSVLP